MSSHELSAPFALPLSSLEQLEGRVGVVGAGKVGLSIALRLHQLSALEWLVVRSTDRARQLSLALGAAAIISDVEHMPAIPQTIVLAVPDAEIESVADAIARACGPALENVLVLHCSGTRGPDVLHSCAQLGARVASAHPFQTFTHAHERLIAGICWGLDCEREDEGRVGSFVRSLGGTPMVLSPFTRAHKALYHISAVFASNYLQALLHSTRVAAEAAHIPPTSFLQPIVTTAVENALLGMAHEGQAPLSGPIARGDIQTIRTHLRELQAFPTLVRQYAYYALATNEFALEQGYIDEDRYLEIRDELEAVVRPAIG